MKRATWIFVAVSFGVSWTTAKRPAGLAGTLVLLAANLALWRARSRAGAVSLRAAGQEA